VYNYISPHSGQSSVGVSTRIAEMGVPAQILASGITPWYGVRVDVYGHGLICNPELCACAGVVVISRLPVQRAVATCC